MEMNSKLLYRHNVDNRFKHWNDSTCAKRRVGAGNKLQISQIEKEKPIFTVLWSQTTQLSKRKFVCEKPGICFPDNFKWTTLYLHTEKEPALLSRSPPVSGQKRHEKLMPLYTFNWWANAFVVLCLHEKHICLCMPSTDGRMLLWYFAQKSTPRGILVVPCLEASPRIAFENITPSITSKVDSYSKNKHILGLFWVVMGFLAWKGQGFKRWSDRAKRRLYMYLTGAHGSNFPIIILMSIWMGSWVGLCDLGLRLLTSKNKLEELYAIHYLVQEHVVHPQ